MIIWLAGLSGSGKTTLAKELLRILPRGFLVDGDLLREDLCNDLGFDGESRHEQARRAAGVAKIADANVCTAVCSVITPLRESRDEVRKTLSETQFYLVYVSTPIETCRERDPKGLYKKVDSGEITNFTGVDGVFESPTPDEYDSIVDTSNRTVNECVDQIISDIGL